MANRGYVKRGMQALRCSHELRQELQRRFAAARSLESAVRTAEEAARVAETESARGGEEVVEKVREIVEAVARAKEESQAVRASDLTAVLLLRLLQGSHSVSPVDVSRNPPRIWPKKESSLRKWRCCKGTCRRLSTTKRSARSRSRRYASAVRTNT